MTSFDRFERSLPELFDELAAPRTPDYFDDILTRTAASRQRPGWTFPERWIPLSALTARLATAPRMPLRLAAVAALLIVAALIGVLLAGSGKEDLPAPFGIAGNGEVAFLDPSGRILLGDLATGQSKVIVAGPGHSHLMFSPDGSRLAFLRINGDGSDLVTTKLDGSDQRILTVEPIPTPGFLAWSPTGDFVLTGALQMYSTSGPGKPVDLSQYNNIGAVQVGTGLNDRTAHVFRPPAGSELLFVNSGGGADVLAAMKPDGSGYRELIKADSSLGQSRLRGAQWSPDGSQIVVMVEFPVQQDRWHLFLLNADGSNVRPLNAVSLDPLVDEGHPMWSPDGSRIAFMRWSNHVDGTTQFHPLAVVDVATGDSRFSGRTSTNGYFSWEWSPDGMSILAAPGDDTNELLLVDAATGEWTVTPWSVPDGVSWQRVALP